MPEDHEQAAGNGLEEEMQRLEWAEEAVQQAVRSAESQGPAMQHTAHAVLQVLKYAAQLGIKLGELADTFARVEGIAGVAREMTELGRLVDEAGGKLAAPPEELAQRLASIKAGETTVQGGTLTLQFPAIGRLVAAANRAEVSVADFATKAILDAIAEVERWKPGQ